MRVEIPTKISKNWVIDEERVFGAVYKYDQGRIFKFCFQPETG
jgi:hypothetical protein